MTLQITEEQRQIILHALAHLAVNRPRWDAKLVEVALAMETPAPNGMPPIFFSFKLHEICPLTYHKPMTESPRFSTSPTSNTARSFTVKASPVQPLSAP